MTVISERIEDIGGTGLAQKVTFVVPIIREADDGTSTVVEEKHQFDLVGGLLTTTDLDPGPAIVRIRHQSYPIIIPVSASPIRLWPLIDAGMPTPPEPAPGFVRSDGTVARMIALTQADYDDIPVPDPATFYVIIDGSL